MIVEEIVNPVVKLRNGFVFVSETLKKPPLGLGLLIQPSTLDDTVPTSHDCPTPYLTAKIGPKPFGPASSPCYMFDIVAKEFP